MNVSTASACETQATAINPTLADLTESPYSLLSRQGICDLGQARRVRDLSKTVVLLGKEAHRDRLRSFDRAAHGNFVLVSC